MVRLTCLLVDFLDLVLVFICVVCYLLWFCCRMLVLVGFGSGLRGCFWFALRFGLGLRFGWCRF